MENVKTPVKGYKVFDPNFKCRDFQFSENETFEMPLPIEICNRGFHFCLKANDCFNYYSFDSSNIVCEVEALGEIRFHEEDSKACTNIIRVCKRLTWQEVLIIINSGKDNTGRANTGNRNTGDLNTGDWNTGNRNTGYRNTGDWNTGDLNTGDLNTGDWNTGNRNTGDRNTGDRNTGYRNTGYRNTGDWNTGDLNTGDWNTGNRNTGYLNTGDRNTGVFCTGEPPLMFFNRPCNNMTLQEFQDSKVFRLLCGDVETKIWVSQDVMTNEEKEKFPSYKTTEGYLKDVPFKEAFANAWHNWTQEQQSLFLKLPNFDKDIFFEVTGIVIK